MKPLSLALASTFLLSACATTSDCQIPSSLKGNAGCLITHNDQFLAARHRKKDKWNLPGGTAERGESAECTAARETKEELGLDVSVGELLVQHENGFYLFNCELAADQYQSSYSVPPSGINEVTEIQWLYPDQVKAQDWRYPERWEKMQQLVTEALYD